MTIYKVQDPTGTMREIEGPEGASDEMVISKAKELFSAPAMGPKDVPESPPTATAPKQDPRTSAMDLIRGVPGAIASMGIGTIGQLAGRAVAPFSPETGKKIAETVSYTPSERGQETLRQFQNVLEKSKLEGLGPMVPDIPGATGATKVISGRKVPANVQEATQRGFSLTPSDAGAGMTAKLFEGISGEPKLAKGISKKNVEVANEKIARDLGLPKGTELTAENLAAVEKQAWTKYDAIRKVGKVDTDAKYNEALDKLEETYKSANKDFPEAAQKLGIKDTQEMVAALRKPAFDSNSAVDLIRKLRENAQKAYANGDGGYAKVLRGGAKAIEDQIERHLERPQMGSDLSGFAMTSPVLDEFRAGRTVLAKVHEARKSLAGGTEINPQAYARTLAKSPQLLTGGAKEVGEFAAKFPRSAQKHPTGSINAPTWADVMLGGLSGAGHLATHGLTGGAALPAAAMLAARPATRALMASRPYQRFQALHPTAGVPVPSPEALKALQIAPMLGQNQ